MNTQKVIDLIFTIAVLFSFVVAVFPLTTFGAALLGAMAVNVTSFGFSCIAYSFGAMAITKLFTNN